MTGLSEQEVTVRLAVAAVLGLAIGLERERVEQPAGLRDHALVALGSALIMIVSAYGFGEVAHGPDVVLDPSRIAAQVVTGIGFIGAGTIVLRRNVVRGLTTAASIWAAAALGLAAGGGLFFAASLATVFILVILAGIKSLERRFSRRYRRNVVTLNVQREGFALDSIATMAAEAGVRLERIDVRKEKEAPNNDRVDVLCGNAEAAKMMVFTDALRRHAAVEGVRSSVLLPAVKAAG